jgi:hypothetical protein
VNTARIAARVGALDAMAVPFGVIRRHWPKGAAPNRSAAIKTTGDAAEDGGTLVGNLHHAISSPVRVVSGRLDLRPPPSLACIA